jgi:putative transposase
MGRTLDIIEDEYYHVFNRGSEKKNIFLNNRDYIRFLFLIVYLQSPQSFNNISRYIGQYVKSSAFNISAKQVSEIVSGRQVELVAFCLMPNHFHLLLKNLEEGGVAKYLHRVQTAYSKYFNTKYKTTGHLFQGAYKAVGVEDNNQALYLSAYIHKNPKSLNDKKIDTYDWSSLVDYLGDNRWGSLLANGVILDQFSGTDEYLEFIKTSTAKESDFLDGATLENVEC